jgi:predicted nucleotidyltransferase
MTTRARLSPRELLRAERSRIVTLLESHGASQIRLFGSLARGDDDSQSDIDLVVELPDGQSAAAELLTVLGLSEELSQLLGTRVDVVSARTLRDDVRDQALSEAVAL